MKKYLKPVLLGAIILAATASNAYAKGRWRTCLPSQCSQKQATFDSWRECADFQAHQNSGRSGEKWSKCFEV